jgi:hypothetical protein
MQPLSETSAGHFKAGHPNTRLDLERIQNGAAAQLCVTDDGGPVA